MRCFDKSNRLRHHNSCCDASALLGRGWVLAVPLPATVAALCLRDAGAVLVGWAAVLRGLLLVCCWRGVAVLRGAVLLPC